MVVIDTYNVLHSSGVLPPDLAGLDTQGLIDLLAASRFRRREVLLVCDGGGPSDSNKRRLGEGRHHGSFRVIFSGTGRQADDEIESIIAREPRSKGLLVISSDRRIRRAAAAKGFEERDSPAFLRQLADDWARGERKAKSDRGLSSVRDQVPLDAASVAHWARHLGVDGESAERLAQLILEAEAALKGLHTRAMRAAHADPAPEPPLRPLRSTAKPQPKPLPKPPPASSPTDRPSSTPQTVADDLAHLLREYNQPVAPTDLDMNRWLATHPNPPPRPADPPPPSAKPARSRAGRSASNTSPARPSRRRS